MKKTLSRHDLALSLCAIVLGFTCIWLGLGRSVDFGLRQARDALHQHPASGEIVVVEIDAKSLAAIDQWPWPRRAHAQMVDRLRQYGARITAFDVDFSTASTPLDDRLFSEALARAKDSVVLPTFRQQRSVDSTDIYENLPIDQLRRHAFLGGVNIFTESDGLVRRYETGVVTDHLMRPSIGALLAENSSPASNSLTIDLSIDPATIPRFSYIDVLNGSIPRVRLANKRVLIGATAIEMGDRYAVPGHGVLPGVIIQALAAETLFQGAGNSNWGPWPLFALISVLIFMLNSQAKPRTCKLILAGGFTGIFLTPLVLEYLKLGSLDCAPSLFMLLFSTGLFIARGIQRNLRQTMMTDAETALPNAVALAERLKSEPTLVVATARIQHFSELSSLLGPEQRADLFKQVVDRLQFANESGITYRVAENALAWSLPSGDHQLLSERFDALSALFRSSIMVGGRSVDLSLTYGVAEGESTDAKSLLALALLAADRAAEQGLRWDIHNAQHGRDLDWKLSLFSELDEALVNGDLWLAYQPKVALDSGLIIGAEALIRWSHHQRGPIAPEHFIHAIEDAGRIHDLTIFVVKTAMSQLEDWENAGHQLSLAVNISASLLGDSMFIAEIIDLVSQSPISPSHLTFEITETAALADPDTAIAAMKQLRDLGLRISIDDYGTGQSTLSYLKQLPADEIKIDKCFITNLIHDKNDQILVRSTIALAHELGFSVVAEGIEDAACLRLITSFGCDIGQGWEIGKPMPVDDFQALLSSHQSNAA